MGAEVFPDAGRLSDPIAAEYDPASGRYYRGTTRPPYIDTGIWRNLPVQRENGERERKHPNRQQRNGFPIMILASWKQRR